MKRLRDQLQQLIYKIINPVVSLFIKIGLTPNMITLLGLIFNMVVTGILIFGAEKSNRGDLSYIGYAGGLILFAGLFDMLDGQVARMSNKSSKFGALFDSVLDRYSEMILFFGICYYLVAHHYFLSSVFAFMALIGSMMVSYVRSRAEGLGVSCTGGLMQRPERIVLISISGIACGITASVIGSDFKLYIPNTNIQVFETMSIFTFPIAVMAVLTNLTAIGRLKEAKLALDEADEADDPDNRDLKEEAEQTFKKEDILKSEKKYSKSFFITVLLCTGIGGFGELAAQKKNSEADRFPKPAEKAMMFYLQRTSNTNTIVYSLNYDEEKKLKKSEPIKVYWIRYTEPGSPIKKLNFIEKKFAYGIKARDTGNDTWSLSMVAYDKLSIKLRKGIAGGYSAFVTINNRDYIFQKAYIKIDGGSFWSPNIPYIDIFAKDETKGHEIIHRINNPKSKKNG
ncbi:DUF4833 domain-containing protein [Chryseobacterium lathyri]|uniref:Phosphatidylglycerophosphate synthase n=1 Tax=Chryseobacterium lathyri TaxID=395933 RepID=A0ABT9SQY1_9FLAO|nr:DUF4833 domain-containing protein [Chryseobacterium lathyri]MDP9961847.1 phosphatidylglycerophosphate synthase [Chryseobacterium lathyri]